MEKIQFIQSSEVDIVEYGFPVRARAFSIRFAFIVIE
jgi:hypothetical protein